MKVINDVRQILQIPRCILFRAPFNRKNLFYEVLHKSDVGKDAFNDLVHCIHHRLTSNQVENSRKYFPLSSSLFSEKVLFIVYHKKMQKMYVLNYKEIV
jgi:superfamily II DNA helicase RecQ